MAISEKRLREFERRTPQAMARWLEIAATRYFCGAEDADAFRPFELFIGRTESTASDIHLAYGQLSASGMTNFRSALVRTLSSIEAKPDRSEIWMFLIELAWLLPEPTVVEALKDRFNDVSLDDLCADDPDLFRHILGYIRNLAPHTQGAAECIHLLARSRHYHHRFSRQTLLRLCEIDPGKWTRHFSLLHDSMRTFFGDIEKNYSEETMLTVRNKLACDIFDVMGFDRFMDGLSTLYRMTGNDDFEKEPSTIDWYWKSLVERKRIRIETDHTAKKWIAPHDDLYEQRCIDASSG